MNRTTKLLALAIVCVTVTITMIAQGQTKPERTPVTLSAEASQQWTITSLQIQNLQQQQQILLLKARVPDDYQLAGRDGQGQLVFVAPAKPEAAKASPSPK